MNHIMSNETRYYDQYRDTATDKESQNGSLYKTEPADRNADFHSTTGDDGYSDNNTYHDIYPYYEATLFDNDVFDFERPIYQFIWETLVIITTLFNIVVIVVLLRMRMRNVIHMLLVAIAISDSMTGLVTLPTYIYVYTYSHYEPKTKTRNAVYILDKYWCNAFMISKFFLSKWFHNVSIWLTLFLGVQRFVSVFYPFKAQRMFAVQNTLAFITVIFGLSPFLHIYHLIYMKADERYHRCTWILEGDWVFVQMWATLLLMHLIPAILLVILTVMIICRLFSTFSQISRTEGSNVSMTIRRHEWNRRMSVIFSAIALAFLTPELPYATFLLITLIHDLRGKPIMPLNVNRAFHAGYEILLVLSFHTNFWIYTIINKRFRSELKKTASEIQKCILRFSGQPVRDRSITTTSCTGPKTTTHSASMSTRV